MSANLAVLSSSLFVRFVTLLSQMFIYLPVYCFKCAQDTVRHGISVIEWSGYTLLSLETGSFTVLEHKTKILLFACQNMLFIFSKVHSQLHKLQFI